MKTLIRYERTERYGMALNVDGPVSVVTPGPGVETPRLGVPRGTGEARLRGLGTVRSALFIAVRAQVAAQRREVAEAEALVDRQSIGVGL